MKLFVIEPREYVIHSVVEVHPVVLLFNLF